MVALVALILVGSVLIDQYLLERVPFPSSNPTNPNTPETFKKYEFERKSEIAYSAHSKKKTYLVPSKNDASATVINSVSSGHGAGFGTSPIPAHATAFPVRISSVKDENKNIDGRSKQKTGLSCDKYGGPSQDIAAEMVYWQGSHLDAKYVSPFLTRGPTKYLTFEPDHGGWNSLETIIVMAIAMGRTLVMPPEQKMYLLDKSDNQSKNTFSKNTFSFKHVYDLESVVSMYDGLNIISMEDYMRKETIFGNTTDPVKKKKIDPPKSPIDSQDLISFLRRAAIIPPWDYEECIVVFPANAGQGNSSHLDEMLEDILAGVINEHIESFRSYSIPVDTLIKNRMKEMLSFRKKLCKYDYTLQNAPVLHFKGEGEYRLLEQFSSVLFFEDNRQDVWMKRFVRDCLHYSQEIQCAAARVVNAIRHKGNKESHFVGIFDAFHIRRHDFRESGIGAHDIYENTKHLVPEDAVVYVATDEDNMSLFQPLSDHFKLYFLSDFTNEIGDLNKNLYRMLDTLVASKGRTFIGTLNSSLTGYIKRIRGYHSQYDAKEGTQTENLRTTHSYSLTEYTSNQYPAWSLKFPISWRDINAKSSTAPIYSPKPRKIFTVFSTNCSPEHDWQAQTLSFNHKKMGIEGNLVRLMACDNDYELPKNSYKKYYVIRTPFYNMQPEQCDYPSISKPMSLSYWLAGLSDISLMPASNDIIILVNQDQLFLSRNHDFSMISGKKGVASKYSLRQSWIRDWGKEFCHSDCDTLPSLLMQHMVHPMFLLLRICFTLQVCGQLCWKRCSLPELFIATLKRTLL